MGNCNNTITNECGCKKNIPVRPAAPVSKACPMQARPAMPRPCTMKGDPLAGLPVGMAYVPWQYFRDVYEPDKALQYGTIFPELNKPFYGRGGCPR